MSRRNLIVQYQLTTDGYVAELHADPIIQSETPGGFVLIPRVAAVGVSTVQLRVTDRQEGVAVGVLGVPGLTLSARLGQTDSPAVVCPTAVVALVICRTTSTPL